MTEDTKQYQITLLFSPALNQEDLDQAIQKIKKLITDQGGSFHPAGRGEQDAEPIAQLKKLSYPINKNNEAFYLTFNNVSLPAQAIESIKQQLNLEHDCIRYLIARQSKIKEKVEPIVDYSKMVEKVEKIEEKKPVDLAQRGEPATKSQIKDLDKKLEEILSE